MAAETRSVVVRLSMEASQYVREAQRTGKIGADAMSQIEKGAKGAGDGVDQLGNKAGKAALVAAAGLAAVTKAAVDWESQFAGVTKTVDGTTAQLDGLEDGLRGLARTLPATHEEIAGVAEAAGQLGVKREDILSFTKTMVDLGETTNLTAEDAATNIAQMANVMGTAGDEVDNLGASLVAVGNAGASTERQIIEMAQGIAGAAHIVGLTESEVLGIANAIASIGIEVEAGSTSVSRVLTDMAKAVSQGGEKLDLFAQAAGTSAADFATAFKETPAEALVSFVEGLGKINERGGDVFTTLDQLGLSDVRVSKALLGMAADSDKFAGSIELAGKAWEENTALSDEAGKRYETTAAKVQIAWNQIKDAGIEAGSVLLPILVEVAGTVGTIADAFGALPDPVQNSLTGLLAVTAVVGGTAWFGARVVGGIRSTRAELALLAAQSPKTAAALNAVTGSTGRLSKAKTAALLGGIAIASTGAADGIGLSNTASLALMGTIAGPWGAAIGGGVGLALDFAAAHSDLADEVTRANDAMQTNDIEKMQAALDDLQAKNREMGESGWMGISWSNAIALVNGDMGDVENTAAALEDRIWQLKIATGDSSKVFSDIFAPSLGMTSGELNITTDAAEELADKLTVLEGLLSKRGSLRSYHAALREFRRGLEENGRAIGNFSEKAEANQANLDAIVANAIKLAEELPSGKRADFLKDVRRELKNIGELSPSALAEVRTLTQEINRLIGPKKPLVPKVDEKPLRRAIKTGDELLDKLLNVGQTNARPQVTVNGRQARQEINNLQQLLRGIDPYKEVTINVKKVVHDIFSARGNFFPAGVAYANGGDVRNGHQPQIAAGGSMRIWAEPETGGETYIPHANDSRRPMAKRYLESTAELFGGQVQWYDRGGQLAALERMRGTSGRRVDSSSALVSEMRAVRAEVAGLRASLGPAAALAGDRFAAGINGAGQRGRRDQRP